MNIRDRLLETEDWMEAGLFRGKPLFQRGYDVMVQIDGPSIHDEDLDGDLHGLEWPIHAVWFLSKHRAASGNPSLTVHPIGNHGEAQAGGKPGTLSPAAARDMGALLRRLRHHATDANLPHDVTFEATHHGPLMSIPSLFVEIGSNEDWYQDVASGEVLAAAVSDVLDGEGFVDAPLHVGVGGGHYVPQMTDKALAGEADFGHMVPAYALDPETGAAVLERALEATPGASLYMHKKGLKGPQRDIVRAMLPTES
ncbi:MAG: D-aminoacyl-tRNA deacylase [Thermoplasmatota archaeon]